SRYCLKLARPFVAKPQRNDPKDAERTINHSPPNRNPSNRAKDQRIRNHHYASDHPESEQPGVSYWIKNGSKKRNCDHEMAESQPIGAIKQKWSFGIRVGQG